ncbi:MAG: ribosome silencing factor [Flavobacteriales bacterium]|jgi:ribosome-associated protein|tara:strand:+ start:1753 stop:2127 length:375 start_codon:yes stop_codon:yes gene_type:complete
MKEDRSLEIKALVDVIVKGMQEKKAENITVIDLREIDTAVCDFFVISNANSNTQVNAIADSIQKETLETLNDKAWRKEGTETSEWVLMDYVNVVAHIFQTPVRDFYALEELWGDAKITSIESQY